MKVKWTKRTSLLLAVSMILFAVPAVAVQPADLPNASDKVPEKAVKGLEKARAAIAAVHGQPAAEPSVTSAEAMMKDDHPLKKVKEAKVENPNKANKGARAVQVLNRNLLRAQERVAENTKAKVPAGLQKAIENKNKEHGDGADEEPVPEPQPEV